MKSLRCTIGLTVLAVSLAIMPTAAISKDLTIGIATETTSIDPHFFTASFNMQVAEHIFESLVWKDERQQLKPGLAVSWRTIDDKTWEFKLRENVKFQDGTPLTADDVVFTFERALAMKGTSPVGRYVRNKTIAKVDDHTVHVSTKAPYPLVPAELATVPIISRKHGAGATTEDYNSGKATIGTGPYRFVEWRPGDRLVLAANTDYWGGKPQWDRVILKAVSSDPVRVATLLSGDVDMIDFTPTTALPRLRKEAGVNLSEVASNRVIFLILDSNRDVSPYVLDHDGSKLWPNPLRQWRVRKAISKAINRQAIVDRVMQGAAVPAGQLPPDFMIGHDPSLKPEPYDPDGAKRLLAEAGYPKGFRLTVHCPNDRYINDEKICETVAQMLTRVGIPTEVVTMPKAVYFSRSSRGDPWGNPEFSLIMFGAGSDTGDGLTPLINHLGTHSREASFGFSNRGRYSNVRVDKRWKKAQTSLDAAERTKLIQEGNVIAARDVGNIPLHYQMNIWALRKGLTYKARTDEKTHAMGVAPVP